MATNRKIIATPFLLKGGIFRKVKFNNFVGGLIFGAIFSLFVNIITVQIQESINQQLYLEALENEIASHLIQAKVSVQEADKALREQRRPNFYNSAEPYETRVWNNSDGLRYIVKLHPKVQGEISAYYSYIIRGNNSTILKEESLINIRLKDCYFDFVKLTKDRQGECIQEYQSHLLRKVSSFDQVFKHANNALTIFHPTSDRLRNPLMRILIGDKAIEILQSDFKSNGVNYKP